LVDRILGQAHQNGKAIVSERSSAYFMNECSKKIASGVTMAGRHNCPENPWS
jgi:hypothetical protein